MWVRVILRLSGSAGDSIDGCNGGGWCGKVLILPEHKFLHDIGRDSAWCGGVKATEVSNGLRCSYILFGEPQVLLRSISLEADQIVKVGMDKFTVQDLVNLILQVIAYEFGIWL